MFSGHQIFNTAVGDVSYCERWHFGGAGHQNALKAVTRTLAILSRFRVMPRLVSLWARAALCSRCHSWMFACGVWVRLRLTGIATLLQAAAAAVRLWMVTATTFQIRGTPVPIPRIARQ